MQTAAAQVSPEHLRRCGECQNEMPIDRTQCPHCGRPQYFPNVDLAKRPSEKQKLEAGYRAAVEKAKQTGCETVVEKFAAACAQSAAVFNCQLQKLHREICTGTNLFETYHDLERLRLQMTTPGAFDWAKLRPQAEIELLGTHKHLDKIHYACLSIGSNGLSHYGPCTVRLAEAMIAHRASCFDGNTAIQYQRERGFAGVLRCEWGDRHKICTAVFAGQIGKSTRQSAFAGILIAIGASAKDDKFIEVHVFGPMTAKTFASVAFDKAKVRRRERSLLAAVEEKLARNQIEVTNP